MSVSVWNKDRQSILKRVILHVLNVGIGKSISLGRVACVTWIVNSKEPSGKFILRAHPRRKEKEALKP
jgi:hypothetical protein